MKWLILVLLLFFFSPAAALETWYLRTDAGSPACMDGDDESLNTTAGSSAATKLLDGTGDSWSQDEDRTIPAGNWQVCVDIASASGGSSNQVLVKVFRWSSICVPQDTIISEALDITADTTAEYCTASTAAGEIVFAATEVLAVVLTDSFGAGTKTVRYGNTASTDADSRVTFPEQAGAAVVPKRRIHKL